MCIPGIGEWIIILFMGLFVYALPLAFAVFVIVFLIRINKTVVDIQKKLDQSEQKQE